MRNDFYRFNAALYFQFLKIFHVYVFIVLFK